MASPDDDDYERRTLGEEVSPAQRAEAPVAVRRDSSSSGSSEAEGDGEDDASSSDSGSQGSSESLHTPDPSTGKHNQQKHHEHGDPHNDFQTVLSLHPPVAEGPRFSRLAAEVCARLDSLRVGEKPDASLRSFEAALARGRAAAREEVALAPQKIPELANTVPGEGDVHDRLTRSLLWPLTQSQA